MKLDIYSGLVRFLNENNVGLNKYKTYILKKNNIFVLTWEWNAWPNISLSFLANCSDFPVSVAYKIVALILLESALPNNFDVNFTALKIKYLLKKTYNYEAWTRIKTSKILRFILLAIVLSPKTSSLVTLK